MSDTVTIDKERYQEEQLLLELYSSITSWGSRDLATAAEWLNSAGMDFDKFGEFVEEFCKDTGVPMQDADIAAMALEFIANETAPELSQYVYSNYMCSDFDVPEDTAGEILYAIPEDERGESWEFLREQTNATKPEEESEDESA